MNKVNLLDLMTEDDRKSVRSAFKARMSGDSSYRKGLKIPPEVYLLSELGYFFGWGAIQDAKRGYVEDFDEATGKRLKIPLTLEEVNALVEGARKVWYSRTVDYARAVQAGAGSMVAKNPASAFKKAVKPYVEASKL